LYCFSLLWYHMYLRFSSRHKHKDKKLQYGHHPPHYWKHQCLCRFLAYFCLLVLSEFRICYLPLIKFCWISGMWYTTLSETCCGTVYFYRPDSLPMERILQQLKKKNPFTDLPKETQNILEYVLLCKLSFLSCHCNWTVTVTTCIAPLLERPRVHHRVNPYLGACGQNETEMFWDHDETSPSIAAVLASSVACSLLAVQQQKRLCRQFVDMSQ